MVRRVEYAAMPAAEPASVPLPLLASPPASPLVEPRRYAPAAFGHAHDYHQLLFGIDGALELEVDGHAYRVDATHGLVIPAGAHHVCAGLVGNFQLVADFPPASVALPAGLMARPRAFALDGALAACVRELAAPPEVSAMGTAMGTALNAPARCLPLQHAWQRAARLATALAGRLGDAGSARFPVAAIDAYLRANLATPVRADRLAAHFGWGARRFHALFCEAFGDTPHAYQTRLRLDQAVQWLMAGEMPLLEIAFGVGYPDQTTFARAFARRFGLPPGAWRGSISSKQATSPWTPRSARARL